MTTDTLLEPTVTPAAPPDTDMVDTPTAPPVTPPILSSEAPEAAPTPVQHTQVDFAYSSPLSPEMLKQMQDGGPFISLPSHFDSVVAKNIEGAANLELGDNKQSREWGAVVADGYNYTTSNNVFVPTLEAPGSDFRQFVEFNGVRLTSAQPRFKESEHQTLTGERAVARVSAALGLGTPFGVALWNTGIWVTLKAPSDSDIIELNRTLLADKIQLGRATYGIAFSNLTAFTNDRLVDFALAHVRDTSIRTEDLDKEGLRGLIRCQDIPSLLWGMARTMYPRGFPYKRACITDPQRCTHVTHALLNLEKLQYPDNAALTDWQRTHMAVRRPYSKSRADVERYMQELTRAQPVRTEINTDNGELLAITLRTPSINTHIDAGFRWINTIVTSVENALASDATDAERNKYIIRHGQATLLRQFAHWVESIEVGTNAIDDAETIEKVLNQLTSDATIRERVVEHVIAYINKSTASVIAIPVYDCPVCGEPQDIAKTLPYHADLIPLDVTKLFFEFITQRVNQIIQR